MLNLAIIGCGRHSEQNHATALQQYVREHPGEVNLIAACDLDSARTNLFSLQYGFAKAYNDVDAMLRHERLDACVCVMPVPHIVKMARRLLERGMTCSIEKPLGASIDEARELARVAKATNTPHMVSVDRRFNPWLNRAKQWATQRGPIHCIVAAMTRHARIENGFITDTGIHAVDAMRHLGGEVEQYQVSLRTENDLTAPWGHVTFRFRGGIEGRLDILPTCGRHEERYEIYGDGYCAAASIAIGMPGSLRCWQQNTIVFDESDAPDTPLHIKSGADAETAAFIHGCQTGTMSPTVADILPSQEICHALLNPAAR